VEFTVRVVCRFADTLGEFRLLIREQGWSFGTSRLRNRLHRGKLSLADITVSKVQAFFTAFRHPKLSHESIDKIRDVRV